MVMRLSPRIVIMCLFISLFSSTIQGTPYEDMIISPDHKVKNWLDKMFKERGYPGSQKGFMKMGFRNFTRPDSRGAQVFKHRSCGGYLFKLYANNDGSIDEGRVLANRIKGAEVIRQYIEDQGYQAYFKVPKKWLYYHDSASHYILVVEDMKILNQEKNMKAWKSKKVNEGLLQALAATLKDLGLIDSIYIDNIPFCNDGKIAFIDTEHYHNSQPVRLSVLDQRLPKHLLPYWQSLRE